MDNYIRKKQSLQYSAFILLFSAVIVKLIGALFKIPLSSERCLGDLGFGYFSSAYDFFTPVYTLALAGLPVAAARIVSENAAQKRFKDVRAVLKITSRMYLIIGIIGFLIMLALIYPITYFTDKTGKTVYSIAAISPSIFFCCIMSAYRGYYQGLSNMYPTAVSEITEALCKLFLGYGFAYYVMLTTHNAAYSAAAAMLGITAGTALSVLYLKLYHKLKGDLISDKQLNESPNPKDTLQTVKLLVIIAVPIALASLSTSIAPLIDVLTVRRGLTELITENSAFIREIYANSISSYNNSVTSALSDAEIPTFLYGIRSKAYTLYNLVPTLTAVVGISCVPSLAAANSEKNTAALKSNINSAIKLSALIAFPAGFGFIAAGPQIMGLLYGGIPSVEIGGTIIRIFGAALIFSGIAIPMTSMLQALGCQVKALVNILIGSALKMIINSVAVSIPQLNINGAPIGTLVCYASVLILHSITLIKYTGIKPDLKNTVFKLLISAVLSAISAYTVLLLGNSKTVTVSAIFTAALVYFLVLAIVKVFNEEDFSAFPNGFKIIKVLKKIKFLR